MFHVYFFLARITPMVFLLSSTDNTDGPREMLRLTLSPVK